MKFILEFFSTKLIKDVVVDFQCVQAIVINFLSLVISAKALGYVKSFNFNFFAFKSSLWVLLIASV